MRHALVLTNEAARHPFRVYFVHTAPSEHEAEKADREKKQPARLREDLSFFLLSYVSGLIIFLGIIA